MKKPTKMTFNQAKWKLKCPYTNFLDVGFIHPPEHAMDVNVKKNMNAVLLRKIFPYHSKGDRHHSLVDYCTYRPLHEYEWHL